MSPKELLYIEDALNFEQSMQNICSDNAQLLQEKELQNFVAQLSSHHKQIFDQFYNLV